MKKILMMVLGWCILHSAYAFDHQAFAEKAQVTFGVSSNFLPEGKFKAYLDINNTSSESLPPGDTQWRIYLHFVRRVTAIDSNEFTLERVQGDLYRLTPTEDFEGIFSGESKRITFEALGYISSYSYFMPNAFIVDGEGKSYIFASTAKEDPKEFSAALSRPEQYLRFDQPNPDLYPVATPQSRFEENLDVSIPEKTVGIIPSPKEIHLSKGRAKITSDWSLYQSGGLNFSASYLKRELSNLGVTLADTKKSKPEHSIALLIDKSFTQPEHYELNIKSNQVIIRAGDKAGIYYGVQSFIKLLPLSAEGNLVSVPAVRIFDEPRYPWRGMHYDVARNFHGKQTILSLVEQMGRYKLNKLHLHLTDDEGWRLEIPDLPELTDVGANRCFDLSETNCLLTQLGSGPKPAQQKQYLSRQDYIDIVRYASDRNIEVIPEIDMPGHARAAIVSMKARYRKLLETSSEEEAKRYLLSDPQDKSQYLTVQSYTDNSINVCMESTYHFVEKVMYEIQRMHRDAGEPLRTFHMGGDEVGRGSWEGSPICQALFTDSDSGILGADDLKPYFVKRVAKLASDRGMAIAGWEDGLMYDKNTPFLRKNLENHSVIANAWDNIWELGVSDRAYLLANAGYEVVLSSATHLYFDHPYESSPDELGYNWATRYTDVEKVFSFRPDDLYANASRTFSGAKIDNLEKLTNKLHVGLERPENILGIQGQLWTETLRTPNSVETMIFPRLIALAERAWRKAEWEKSAAEGEAYQEDWTRFLSILVNYELPKLDQSGVQFYVPPPGLKVKGESVQLNSALPNVNYDFSVNSGNTWKPVSENRTALKPDALYRSRIGGQVSRAVTLSQ
ncbi:family 20 glycosylhydrolase [Gilvimarinus sp. DA14]|uniref:family 20 glycosylhydrolase n=1 Tax=Gilvimarinus sp. DA14 TaxID=2956798 RepID=UPI0020B70153|nr:family 20 glycosylhydrolase [Gilvimarinus sp. DA14]UTF59071.1 carbohydate-binding domain-containing protein [Gilvimarinus sp. DA14]